MSWRRVHRIAAIALVAFGVQGCAAAGLALLGTGTGLAAGAGVDHTLSGITYKTFAVSQNELRLATLRTLYRMDLTVTRDKKEKEFHSIIATAKERTIEIELEALSRRTTRMRVVANKGDIFFKDAATATEIVVQTAATLDDMAAREQQARSRNR